MILTHLQRSFRLFRISGEELDVCVCKLSANLDLLSFKDGSIQNDHLMMLDMWLGHVVENTVVYDFWHEMDITTLDYLKNNVMMCPGDPDDYTLAQLFLRKMQSILQNTVTIMDLQFSTDNGPGIAFTITPDTVELPNITEWVGARHYWSDPWWDRGDGSTMDIIPDEDSNLNDKPDVLIDLTEFLPQRDQPRAPAEILKPNFQLKIINNDSP
ncbi:hypothetical protein UFOVP29_76 [uncultured Caudovirales phage]|uniref:Uncharacterized protein n=1 Tax=uncultured Caudovirales phage TaxID=2100421 RepID=A0A6J5KM28_9CAUD|nr:hypothetical protein UFOVP29_76 [uncultured Caudovirales phage]